MLCCRVVISCPSGGVGGGGDELESSGAGLWLAGGGRAQGSEFLGAGRPLAGGVSAERCGGWDGWSGLHSALCIRILQAYRSRKGRRRVGRARAKGPWHPGTLALPEWEKNRKRPNLAGLGKLLLGRVGTGRWTGKVRPRPWEPGIAGHVPKYPTPSELVLWYRRTG